MKLQIKRFNEHLRRNNLCSASSASEIVSLDSRNLQRTSTVLPLYKWHNRFPNSNRLKPLISPQSSHPMTNQNSKQSHWYELQSYMMTRHDDSRQSKIQLDLSKIESELMMRRFSISSSQSQRQIKIIFQLINKRAGLFTITPLSLGLITAVINHQKCRSCQFARLHPKQWKHFRVILTD
jgi:hypothetical protein